MQPPQRKKHVFAIPILILLLAVPALSQTQTGSITGRAIDNSGALIPGVEVTITRISKTFKFGDHHSVEGTLDIFNTTNVNTVTSQVTSQTSVQTAGQPRSNLDYGKPLAGGGIDASAASSIIAARILRFGARWRF